MRNLSVSLFLTIQMLAVPSFASSLDTAMVRRVVRTRLPQIKTCYTDGLRRNSSLEGKIAISFTVRADGRVGSSRVRRSELSDPLVERCVADVFLRLIFPEHDRETITIIYPLKFKRPK